jgi:hypothetical protein
MLLNQGSETTKNNASSVSTFSDLIVSGGLIVHLLVPFFVDNGKETIERTFGTRG